MKNRPETTLFILTTIDGKITTGDSDLLDSDQDWRRIVGVKEGLQQYYDLERQTDLHSLNSGRVMAKIGINDRDKEPEKMDVSFIIIDSKPHLTESGVRYLSKWVKTLYMVTANKDHPACLLAAQLGNIVIISYPERVDLEDMFQVLHSKYGVEKITIQSGGTMNAAFLRQGLIDHLSIVIAPLIVGGKDTTTLVDGESLHTVEELSNVRALKLVRCDVLEESYIHLRYDVINETGIEN